MLHFVDSNSGTDWAAVCNLVNSDRKTEMMFLMDNLNVASESVLEIGCNVGELTALLADNGARVCAVDPSSVMVSEARKKIKNPETYDRATFRETSFMEIEQLLGQQYGLIVVPSNGFMSIIDPEDQQEFLLTITRLLLPNGKLILVSCTPQIRWLMADPAVIYHYKDVFKHDGGRLILSAQSDYDDYSQVGVFRVYAEFLDDDGVVTKKISHNFDYRFTYVWEMHNLLKLCGFHNVKLYGDFDQRPHHQDCESMIWVAAT